MFNIIYRKIVFINITTNCAFYKPVINICITYSFNNFNLRKTTDKFQIKYHCLNCLIVKNKTIAVYYIYYI